MENKIKFKDLSIPNKLAIIGGWASFIIFGLSLLIGFLQGILLI